MTNIVEIEIVTTNIGTTDIVMIDTGATIGTTTNLRGNRDTATV